MDESQIRRLHFQNIMRNYGVYGLGDSEVYLKEVGIK